MARKSYQETLAKLQARRTKILEKEYDNEANRQRALTKADTEIRHADPNQCIRYVIDFKIKPSELKKHASEQHDNKTYGQVIIGMMLQAKWLKNSLIAQMRNGTKASELDTKATEVDIKVGNHFEKRDISGLSSQMKQGIKDRIGHSLSSLHGSKEAGRKVGNLKFTSRVDSIYLKQFNNTYRFTDDKFTHIKIQGISRPFKVVRNKLLRKILKTHDIENLEWANASIVTVGKDVHVKATVYVKRNGSEDKYAEASKDPDQAIRDFERVLLPSNVAGELASGLVPFVSHDGLRVLALDFSATGVVGEDDVDRGWFFPESEAYKEAQRRNQQFRDWSKKARGRVRNSKRQMRIMQREGRLLRARKDDAAAQFVNFLFRIADVVVVQEEQLADWDVGGDSRSDMHHSILGRVKSRLMDVMVTGSRPGKHVVVIDKYAPTTKVCSECGAVVGSIPVSVREWDCPVCGHHNMRDGNAARVMRLEASPLLDFFGWARRMNEEKGVKDVSSGFTQVSRKAALGALEAIRRHAAVVGVTGM